MTISLGGALVLVGAGKMGGAMLSGWVEEGLAPTDIVVLDPAPSDDVRALAGRRGLNLNPDIAAIGAPAVVVLAVKPQIMEKVLPGLARFSGAGTVFLSIAAGRTLNSLQDGLGEAAAIVRSMPNTPASVGCGISVACSNAAVTPDQAERCIALLSAVGEVVWIDDESLLDAVTAISGSGPAYVFLLTECMAHAGVQAGLDPKLASQLARVTVEGSAELMRRSGLNPETLRRNVTSRGGTTEAALDILKGENGLKDLMTRAVAAAAKRSRELSS